MPEGTSSATGIGASVKRKEDFRFLTGRGTYTDDINRPGQTYAYILRSPHAAADIVKIDTGKAAKAPGVVAILTGADYDKGGLPAGWQIHSKDGSPMIEPPHFPLCKGQGAACRRPGGPGHRRDLCPGPRCGRADRRHL